MDFTDGDLKEIFVDKNAQPLKNQISLFGKSSSDSQDKWLEEYEEEPLKYRTADMNDPEILKSFLRMLGIPYRPFDEVMAEIAQYIEKRKLNKTDPRQLQLAKLERQLNNLSTQLKLMGVEPRLEGTFTPIKEDEKEIQKLKKKKGDKKRKSSTMTPLNV